MLLGVVQNETRARASDWTSLGMGKQGRCGDRMEDTGARRLYDRFDPPHRCQPPEHVANRRVVAHLTFYEAARAGTSSKGGVEQIENSVFMQRMKTRV